jgi:hypothetical protein
MTTMRGSAGTRSGFGAVALTLLVGISGGCAADGGNSPGLRGDAPGTDELSPLTGGEDSAIGVQQSELASNLYGTVTYLGDIPDNKKTSWFGDAQGVALGALNGQVVMFYADKQALYGREAQSSSQFGISQDMPAASWRYPGMPFAGYNHYGDLDYVHNATPAGENILLVPLENSGHTNPQLVVFSVGAQPTLTVQSTATLYQSTTGEAPWVAAYKPDLRYIFSSEFTASRVTRYRDADPGVGVRFDTSKPFPLTKGPLSDLRPLTLIKIQGGEFNAAGKLFLLAQDSNETSGAAPGIYAFQFVAAPASSPFGAVSVLQLFDFYPIELHLDKSEELEGITLGLIDPPGANDRSQIHALLNQDHEIFFKHWSVSQGTGDFTLP